MRMCCPVIFNLRCSRVSWPNYIMAVSARKQYPGTPKGGVMQDQPEYAPGKPDGPVQKSGGIPADGAAAGFPRKVMI
jgi:hypothetical protein